MSPGYKNIRHLIVATNPFPVDVNHRQVALTARAEADLSSILSETEQEVATSPLAGIRRSKAQVPVRRGSRRLGLAAVGALASVAAALLIAPSLQHRTDHSQGMQSLIATPIALRYELTAGSSLSPADQLKQIAERVKGLPDDTGQGEYARISTQSWSLFTRVSGASVSSTVTPSHQIQWVSAGGSGQSVSTTTGQNGTSTQNGPAPSLMWPLGSLGADDDTLAHQLEQEHPVSNGPAERLIAIHDAYEQMPLSPAVRAAILRYLAATPGLTYSGESTDRSGRNALAFSVESDFSGLPTRYTLLIDAHTGGLLDYEETLTQKAGSLNVKIPAVIDYLLIETSGYTDHLS